MQVTKEDFFSMDRLVEFGMGMAMSQQIVQNMNNMMASMRQMPQMQVYAQPLYAHPAMQTGVPMQPVYRQYAGQPEAAAQPQAPQSVPQTQIASQQPGATQAGEQPLLPPPLPEVYYIAQGGRQAGPYSGTEIARLVIEKQVSASTPVWKSGLTEWKTAADFTELVALIALVPPSVGPSAPVPAGTQTTTPVEVKS